MSDLPDAYYRSSAGIVIPSSSELTGRTIEEAGDNDTATKGLIPRLQQRLIDEHGKREGEGAWGNEVQRTGPGRAAGCLNGVSAKKGDAEWRLCDPRTVHCTQLGSEGSEFSCGYRNIQMLCSALMEWPEYRRWVGLFDEGRRGSRLLVLICEGNITPKNSIRSLSNLGSSPHFLLKIYVHEK